MFKISPVEGERPYGRVDEVDGHLADHARHLENHRKAIRWLAFGMLLGPGCHIVHGLGRLAGWWS